MRGNRGKGSVERRRARRKQQRPSEKVERTTTLEALREDRNLVERIEAMGESLNVAKLARDGLRYRVMLHIVYNQQDSSFDAYDWEGCDQELDERSRKL